VENFVFGKGSNLGGVYLGATFLILSLKGTLERNFYV